MKQIMEYFGGAVIAVSIAPVVLGVFAKLPAGHQGCPASP